MFLHWFEVFVVVEQNDIFEDAKGSDEYVDGLADRDSLFLECSEVYSTLESDIVSDHLLEGE